MPAPTHAKVIIIGSGPAGLTAAVYAARANLAPIVFAGHMYGGQLMLTTEVENYPGFADGIMGPELMEAFRAQAERFGSVIHNVDVTEVDFRTRPFVVRTGEDEYTADTVIVATGASARWLDIPGEARLRGRGVSTCATCDGAFFREKHIVVVGGGDSAMEEALFLTRFGRKVTVIHRRDALRASKIMADRALRHEKIEFIWNSAVEEVIGEDNTTALRLKNLVDGEESTLAADALFIAIGHDPNTGIFKGQLDARRGGLHRERGRRAHEHRGRVRRRRRVRHSLQAGHHGGGLGLQSRDRRREVPRVARDARQSRRGPGLMADDDGAGAVAGTMSYPHAMDIFRRLDGLEALQMMQRGDVPPTPNHALDELLARGGRARPRRVRDAAARRSLQHDRLGARRHHHDAARQRARLRRCSRCCRPAASPRRWICTPASTAP